MINTDNQFQIWDKALAVIRRKLNPNWIENLKGFNYITTAKAIELLNEAFGPQYWSNTNTKISYEKNADEFVFMAEVTIELPNRQLTGIGTCSAKWKQFDTGYKGAFSDALKKALTHIGFFMELYPKSTDVPDVWLKMNKESGILQTIKHLSEQLNEPTSKLMAHYSRFRWQSPIYGTEKALVPESEEAKHISLQIASMYPEYLEHFVQYLQMKIENKKKKEESK